MSTIETVLTRMIDDSEFAESIFADAEKALSEYNLSAEEVAGLKTLPRAEFDTVAALPEERKAYATPILMTKCALGRD